MAATPSSPSPAPDGPSPDEAARALADLDRRRTQTHQAATNSRWVYVVFGVVLGALFAAPDLLGRSAADWTSLGFGILAVGYVILLNTRGGATLLGQPVRPRREEISGRFRVIALLILLAVVLLTSVLTQLPPHTLPEVPYWRTALGVVGGAALAVFGQRMQRGLLSVAVRDDRRTGKSATGGAH